MYQNRVSLIGSGIDNDVAAESLDNVGAWICMQDSGERTLGDQLTNVGCAQRGQGQFGGVEEPVFYERRPNSVKPPNTMVPNGAKFVFGELEVLEKYGSSGRTRIYSQT
jgi:hypothetical protein